MQLTLLKGEFYFVGWVDDRHHKTGENLTILFGRLSEWLEKAAHDNVPVTATVATRYRDKDYEPFTDEDLRHVREQLACFYLSLAGEVSVSEAPR